MFVILNFLNLKKERRRGRKRVREAERERGEGEGRKEGKEGAGEGRKKGGRKSKANAVANTSQFSHQLSQVRCREAWVPSCPTSQRFRGASAVLILGSYPSAGLLRGLMKP